MCGGGGVFIPGSTAPIAVFGQKRQSDGDHRTQTDPSGLSESGYSDDSIAHPMSKSPKITEIRTLESLYIHPKAIDPTKSTPGMCPELPDEPSCKKQFTQVALPVFFSPVKHSMLRVVVHD